MNREGIIEQVYTVLERDGFRGRVVAAERIADLKKEIEDRHKETVFNEVFYSERLTDFVSGIPGDFPGGKSLIIASAFQPRYRVHFTFKGQPLTVIIPPTYSYTTDKKIEKSLMEVLGPNGYSLRSVVVPNKLLATRSGLAEYGRNNITYVQGSGSFHRLKVYLSDLPADTDDWGEPRMMEQCKNCFACIKRCPTGAIDADRFIIRAEKCITFHNEREEPFPDWIDPSWHNCLIGCMYCQSICPVNKDFLDRFEDAETFTGEETTLILREKNHGNLPHYTAEKLARLYLLEDYDLVGRNLGILTEQALS